MLVGYGDAAGLDDVDDFYDYDDEIDDEEFDARGFHVDGIDLILVMMIAMILL